MAEPVDEVTDLLQQLIRNACVNDGTPASGHESRSADLLASYLGTSGLELERFEEIPGRTSLVARIEGSDPSAPTLMLMGHTDVVPANPDRWRRDPFGGELVDGVVWGRGAVDMLHNTASMAVAVRRLTASGFRPRGTLTFLAVADEEAAGVHGAKWLVEQHLDAVRADYVVTEFGGMAVPGTAAPPRLLVSTAEKGAFWCTLRVTGTPGHGSMPLRTDNALVTAAEIVRRLATLPQPPDVHALWRRFVEGLGFPDELTRDLLDPDRIDATCAALPDLGMARIIHACTHTTVTPTILQAGVKTNVIPDTALLDLDIRTLPGQDRADVLAMVDAALGDLRDRVEVTVHAADPASSSPLDTPLWDALQAVARGLVPEARNVPFVLPGATDARFFRRIGAVAYGYGLFSDRIPFDTFLQMFHGDDERVDQESLRLAVELWERLARDFLG